MDVDVFVIEVYIISKGGLIIDIFEDEMIDDNNIEVVEGLKNLFDILLIISLVEDVMYKRR